MKAICFRIFDYNVLNFLEDKDSKIYRLLFGCTILKFNPVLFYSVIRIKEYQGSLNSLIIAFSYHVGRNACIAHFALDFIYASNALAFQRN